VIEKNKIYNDDCLIGMQRIDDGSVDVILTDPPYLYLKNQKLDRPFDEIAFFNEAKRVLKKDGFIVLFGRGTSFYRWNTILAGLKFKFKEEIIWNKAYNTSPLMALHRIHETISVHTKGNGMINRVKIPYLEMKGHDIDAIVTDIKRLKTALKNTKSLNAVLAFLENNEVWTCSNNKLSTSISSIIKTQDRAASVLAGMQNGMNEKSIIRADWRYDNKMFRHNTTGNSGSVGEGDRVISVMQDISFGMSEKSIIKQSNDHYATIHPTQKPVRLLERLLNLVTKEGDLVLDPFSGSASTAIAAYNTGRSFIGFEIDKEFYNASIERLNKVLSAPKQMELFFT
jgi:site-specific DNA-methyltransferase (adenine-specific)